MATSFGLDVDRTSEKLTEDVEGGPQVFLDPSGNALGFKAFADPSRVFAK